jgi:hypothetical protein
MKHIMMETCITYRAKIEGKDQDWMYIKKDGATGCSAYPAQ